MRHLVCSLFGKFFFSALLTIVTMPTAFGQGRADKIAGIRLAFQKINKDSTLKKISSDDPEEFLGHATDGGGQLTGYFKGDTILKIRLILGLSYGEITNEYYFTNGQLIFVYEMEKDFPFKDSTGTLDFENLVLGFEGRYYFDKDSLIQKVTKGKKRFDGQEENISSMLDSSRDLTKFLKPKMKK
jgi:hypothetical protein